MKDIKVFFDYIRKYKVLFITSMFLVVLEVLLNIPNPKLMALIIDTGIPQHNLRYIMIIGGVMILLCISGGIVGFIATLLSGILASKIGHQLRCDMFDKVILSDLEDTDHINKDSFFTKISNDANTLMEFTSEFIHVLVKPAVLFISGIVMTFYINYYFGIILMASLPIQLLLMGYMFQRTRTMFAEIQSKIDDIFKHVRQSISGAKVIKAFSKEHAEVKRFSKLNRLVKEKSYKVWKLSAVLNMIIMLVMNGVIVLILYVGGLQANENSLQMGHILASITYSQQAMMGLMEAGLVFKYLSKSKIAVERISMLLSLNTQKRGKQKAFHQEIEKISFNDVSFQVGEQAILEDISFELYQGERVGVVGKTAAGKTMLMQLLSGLYPSTKGEIQFNDIPIEDVDLADLRSQMAVAPQDICLFSGTIKENILWGRIGDYVEAAHNADIGDFIEGTEAGYETYLYDKGGNLSGGQKQRMQIARALCKKGSVLILDDAVTEIDTISKEKILSKVFSLYKDRILLVMSQNASVVSKCDKIIVLDKGRVSAIGTHEELVKTNEIYQSLLFSQAGGEIG